MRSFNHAGTMVLVLVLLAFRAPSLEQGYEVGDNARSFRLKNVDGQMVSPEDYEKAKGFVVIFTCNSCPYAQKYEDRIIALNQKFESQGFPVLAIMPNDPEIKPADSFDKMQERAESKNYPFPYLIDETQEIARAYGAKYTPHVFILSRQGSDLKVAYIGAIDDNYSDPSRVKQPYVENAIGDLLEGKPVEQSFTKGIGCSIKWKS